jgi:hypothetical protein
MVLIVAYAEGLTFFTDYMQEGGHMTHALCARTSGRTAPTNGWLSRLAYVLVIGFLCFDTSFAQASFGTYMISSESQLNSLLAQGEHTALRT